MKKTSVMLLVAAICAFSYVNAQTGLKLPKEELSLSDFSAESVFGRLSYFAKNVKNKSKAKSVASRSAEIPFTERQRLPEATENTKYYYIRNVKTGEYLQYTGINSALRTVEVPDESCMFFFENRTLLKTGDGMSFYNRKCTSKNEYGRRYYFYGPDVNAWAANGLVDLGTAKSFYFHVSEGNNGFYISDESTDGQGKIWRYDPETGTVVIGELDEYCFWQAEALPVAPLPSTAQDTLWYVIRNVDSGKYIHYEGANVSMSTVTSPDSCSLFFALQSGDGVELHNYTAGPLLCNGTDRWSRNGSVFKIFETGTGSNQYCISASGDIAANDIWLSDSETGLLQTGAFGERSLWEFERISNFREIFGFANNGNVISELETLLLGSADKLQTAQKLSIYKTYAIVYGVLLGAISIDKGYINGVGELNAVRSNHKRITEFFTYINFIDINEEISIYNVGHVDPETGDTINNALAANSILLTINNSKNAHSNVWQMFVELTNDNPKMYLYNNAVGKYLGVPSDEDGDGVIEAELTPEIEKAGSWLINPQEINFSDDLMTDLWTTTLIRSDDTGFEDCYLVLSDPDSNEISLERYDTDDNAKKDVGTLWRFDFGDSKIEDEFYRHAGEAAILYPQLLQGIYGLVKDGCSHYSSNKPASIPESSTCNLVDNDHATFFATQNDGDSDKHYLQVMLETPVSGFHFYMTPYTAVADYVPVSVSVEGSNDGTIFTPIATGINTSSMYDNMYYLSGVMNEGGTAYKYLRFTVEETNTGVGEQEFALSEFYIFPSNSDVANASQLLDSFYSASYMSEDIMEPAVELVKLKAEYYLELNKDNHADFPQSGQYPTAKYNALRAACNNVVANDTESVDALQIALDDFLNSLSTPIYILASAWEDGYSAGWALSANSTFDDVEIKDANIWDIRQWVMLDRIEDTATSNDYKLTLLSIPGFKAPVLVDEITGWNTLYSSKLPAYNIYTDFEGNNSYLSLNEGRLMEMSASPATTTDNKATAWYITNAGYVADYIHINNLEFIEGMAAFGIYFKMAERYRNGERNGIYVYEPENGLTLDGFEHLYSMLKPYYSLGPVTFSQMVARDEISADMLQEMIEMMNQLVNHFPNFHENSATDVVYYRLRGASSGNYVVSDMENGTLKMVDVDGNIAPDVEFATIFHSTLTKNADYVQDVVSYNTGRYIMALDGVVKYDAIPKSGEESVVQGGTVGVSSNGSPECVTFRFDGDNYLVDGTDWAYSTADDEAVNRDWVLEIVDELPVKVTAAGVASFYAPVELRIPEGVTAYVLYDEAVTSTNSHVDISTGKAYAANEDVFNLKALSGGVIPAGLPVLLKAAAGTYHFGVNYERTLVSMDDIKATYCYEDEITNLLEGTVVVTYIPVRENFTHYILANKSKGVGMYKVKTYSSLTSSDGIVTGFEAGKESFQNNGHRAWLPMPNAMSLSAASYQFAIENRENDESTGIVESMRDDTHHEDMIFDLQGRRLEMITVRGMYIINGRRVLVK